jgi:hypothetical protein
MNPCTAGDQTDRLAKSQENTDENLGGFLAALVFLVF